MRDLAIRALAEFLTDVQVFKKAERDLEAASEAPRLRADRYFALRIAFEVFGDVSAANAEIAIRNIIRRPS